MSTLPDIEEDKELKVDPDDVSAGSEEEVERYVDSLMSTFGSIEEVKEAQTDLEKALQHEPQYSTRSDPDQLQEPSRSCRCCRLDVLFLWVCLYTDICYILVAMAYLVSLEPEERSARWIIRMVLATCFGLIGAVGIIRCNKYLVLFAGLWYIADIFGSRVVSSVNEFIVLAVCGAVFALLHFLAFFAFHKERITRETTPLCCSMERVFASFRFNYDGGSVP